MDFSRSKQLEIKPCYVFLRITLLRQCDKTIDGLMIPLSGIANFLPTRRFGSQNKFRAFFLIRKQICWAGHFPQQLEHTSKFPAVYFIDFAGCFTKREWKDHSWKNTAPILKSRNSTETTLSELTMTKNKREFGVLGVSVIMYPSKRCSVEKLWNPIRVLRCF